MTEIECELIGWADCTMNCTKYPTSAPEPVTKYFDKQTCEEQNITVTHVKQVQECKNVTKKICTTLWETNPDTGKQVNINSNIQAIYNYTLSQHC